MDTPRRKVIVRAREGDVIIFSESPEDGEVVVRIKRVGANGKAAPGLGVIRWTDKLRDIWQALTDEGQPRKAVMERAGYPCDSASDKLFRKLSRIGLTIEAGGLVKRNPDAPPHLLP